MSLTHYFNFSKDFTCSNYVKRVTYLGSKIKVQLIKNGQIHHTSWMHFNSPEESYVYFEKSF